ncbi:MAG: copper amine oxidase N-terminal domain-containing protein, partial [Actinomycetota bacterium]|nr:copper amine oxidase N-terminal domain-containing protein [Actinomycetota bacterium]
MKISRKKWLSILLVLSMVATLLLPASGAFAADNITVSATSEALVANGGLNTMGKITITAGLVQTLDAIVTVSVTLPKDKVDASGDQSAIDHALASDIAGYDSGGNTVDLTGTVESVSTDTSGNLKIQYSNIPSTAKLVVTPKAKVLSTASGDIIASVNVKRTNANGYTEDYGTTDVKVGSVATDKTTVSAATAPLLSEGTGKSIATIKLTENLPSAIDSDSAVYFELPSTSFRWTSFTAPSNGWGSPSISSDGQKVTVVRTNDATSSANVFEFNGVITIYPGAPQGDIKVRVSGTSGAHLTTTDVVVGKIGASSTVLTVKDNTNAKDIYPAKAAGQQIEDLEITSDANLTADKTVILTLSSGKWDVDGSGNLSGATLDDLTSLGTFNDGKSIWLKVTSGADKTAKIIGAKVLLPHDAALGDLKVTAGGTLGLTGDYVVSKVVARATATASAKPNVKVGLSQAAGDITLVETGDNSLSNAELKLTLPTGVTFTSAPKIKINSNSAVSMTVDTDKSSARYTLSGMTNGIDTIVISDVKYDIDSRVGTGDISVSLGGDVLNDITEPSNASYGKAVMSVANATVVSATAATSAFVIGSTSYTVNGVTKTMDAAPYIKDSRTFVPVRYVANALGVTDDNIIWDGVKKTVTLIKGDRVVQMTIGSKTMLING